MWMNRQDELSDLYSTIGSQPWNFGGDRFGFCLGAYRAARTLVECSGRNPDTTTARELDEADLWVECIMCDENPRITQRLVMSWRAAVRLLNILPTHRLHCSASCTGNPFPLQSMW